MSIRYEVRRGRAGYDIRTDDGRERKAFPEVLRTPTSRRQYAERRARELLLNGPAEPERQVATFGDFGERWMRDYVRAEGLKPSTVDSYERILRLHLYPALGPVRLDAIGELQVQKVKLRLEGKADKTRACVLSLLAEMLGAAERWEEIRRAPRIELPSYMTKEMQFYDFAEWEALIGGAAKVGPMVLCALLLGGDAGCRRGEIVSLEQTDRRGGRLHILRSEWRGHVGKPKGGQGRIVPLTARLGAAIDEVRHLRGARLLWQTNGRRVGITTLQSWLETSCRRAGLPQSRNLHKLRHTFCSHLAMRGVPAKVIQEWAGHADLATTMRYMHLSPDATDSMIRVLEQPWRSNGAGPSGDRVPSTS